MEKKQKALTLQVFSCVVLLLQRIISDNFFLQASLINKWIKQRNKFLDINHHKKMRFLSSPQTEEDLPMYLTSDLPIDSFGFNELFLQEYDPSVLCFLITRLSISKRERQRTTRKTLLIQ